MKGEGVRWRGKGVWAWKVEEEEREVRCLKEGGACGVEDRGRGRGVWGETREGLKGGGEARGVQVNGGYSHSLQSRRYILRGP